MSFQGMDVDAVEAVSQRLMRQSKEMRSHIPQLDRLVDEAVDRWDGPGRGAIRSDWLARRRDLLAAADAIDTLGRRARDNATKQREASSADGDTASATWLAGAHGFLNHGAWDHLGVAALVAGLGANKNLTGRYSAFSDKVIRTLFGSPEAFRYKRILGGVIPVNSILDTFAKSPFLKVAKGLGVGVSVYQTATTWLDPKHTLGEKVVATIDTTADALKLRPGPWYLGGIALASVNLAIEASLEADFSLEGWEMVAGEVRKDWTVIPESFLEAVVQVGAELPGVFT
ncbi:WXG100 family type VII secretion target [Nostocoides sp.]|uniref:WXG100 family type VII secretion target n=1 Tax=Nostocoides sp. TaxID=1917966 RepID=UPI003BAEF794